MQAPVKKTDPALRHWKYQMWCEPEDDSIRLALADWLDDEPREGACRNAGDLIRSGVAHRVTIRESKTLMGRGDLPGEHVLDVVARQVAACRRVLRAFDTVFNPLETLEGVDMLIHSRLRRHLHAAEMHSYGLGERETHWHRGGDEVYRETIRRHSRGGTWYDWLYLFAYNAFCVSGSPYPRYAGLAIHLDRMLNSFAAAPPILAVPPR